MDTALLSVESQEINSKNTILQANSQAHQEIPTSSQSTQLPQETQKPQDPTQKPTLNETQGGSQANQEYQEWINEYSNALGSFYSELSQLKEMMSKGEVGAALMFAMTVVLPQKTQLGQLQLQRQALAVNDLSYINNLVNTLQNDFNNSVNGGSGNFQWARNGVTQKGWVWFQDDYNKLQNYLKSGDQLLNNTPVHYSYKNADGKIEKGTTSVSGILGSKTDSGSAFTNLENTLQILGAGAGTSSDPKNGVFDHWVEDARNSNTMPQVQPVLNSFSSMQSQVSGQSSYQNQLLQYMQQNQQKILTAMSNMQQAVTKQNSTAINNESKN